MPAFLAAALLFAAPAHAAHPRGSSHGSYHSHDRAHHYHTHSGHTRRYAYGVPRDKHGRIKRSSEEKKKFERQSGYPHGRKGYVVGGSGFTATVERYRDGQGWSELGPPTVSASAILQVRLSTSHAMGPLR
jgi:hypothetical protein